MKKRLFYIGLGCFVAGFLLITLARVLYLTGLLRAYMTWIGLVALLAGVVKLFKGGIAILKDRKKNADFSALPADAEQNKLIWHNQRMQRICLHLLLLPILAMLSASYYSTSVLAAILLIGIPGPLIAFFVYRIKLKRYVTDNIVRQILAGVIDDLSYSPAGHIPESYIHENNMGLPDFKWLKGNDYVRGTYKGMHIELCDMVLEEEEIRRDEEGNEERVTHTVFTGQWISCDCGKSPSADLRMWEWLAIRQLDKGIITDNEAFNKVFRVECDVPQDAFYILTPQMMERILDMKGMAGGTVHMCFSRKGKVHIAIASERDLFTIGGHTDAAALRAQFEWEIRSITNLIDALRLADTMD